MKLKFLLLTFIIICSCKQAENGKLSKNTELNLTLPSFKTRDLLTNRSYTKESFINKQSNGVYLHFWATWCGPCELEFPAFISHAKKFENRNLHFVTMAVNDKPNAIKKFLKKFGPLPKNMTVLMEPNELSVKLGTSKLPETFLLDRNGKFYTKFIGPQNWSSKYYTDQLEKNFLSR
jgi:cytochrome c biogenesis protein CcmG, thiol:disulfide interchange protein DsbE